MGSESVISFFIRANAFSGVCFFCNFVRNKIYVIEIEMFEPVVLARYSKKEAGHNFCDIILPYHKFD